MDVDVSTSVAGNKPQRIRRIQTVTLVLLFMAGIVNFLDRSSLSVAGEAIRGELGLSATVVLVFCFLHFLCLMVFHNYLPVFC